MLIALAILSQFHKKNHQLQSMIYWNGKPINQINLQNTIHSCWPPTLDPRLQPRPGPQQPATDRPPSALARSATAGWQLTRGRCGAACLNPPPCPAGPRSAAWQTKTCGLRPPKALRRPAAAEGLENGNGKIEEKLSECDNADGTWGR